MTADTTELIIDSQLVIPRAEVSFATSRSSGPGGQHVNKVETRVTLLFDVEGSSVLGEEQKQRLRERLKGRMNRLGVLRVTAQRERSQAANRELAEERFVELMRDALTEAPPRRPTSNPESSRRRRLDEKRRRSETKRLRRSPAGED